MSRLIPMMKPKTWLAFVLLVTSSLFTTSLFAQNPDKTMPSKKVASSTNSVSKTAKPTSSEKSANKTAKPSAKAVHESALVIDTHADTTQRLLDEGFDLANPPAGDPGHLDLIKAKKGNLAGEFFSVWVDPEKYKGEYAHRTLALIDAVHQQ